MLTLVLTYWPVLSIVLILLLFLVSLFAPGWAGATAGIVVLLSLGMAIYSVVQKQMRLHREKPIGRTRLILNILSEIIGITLAMAFAGLLGRYIAEIATGRISNDLAKLIAGIGIGLLVGICVGVLVRRTWGRFVS